MLNVPEFCCQARRISAGILYVFQRNSTQPDDKRQVQAAFLLIFNTP